MSSVKRRRKEVVENILEDSAKSLEEGTSTPTTENASSHLVSFAKDYQSNKLQQIIQSGANTAQCNKRKKSVRVQVSSNMITKGTSCCFGQNCIKSHNFRSDHSKRVFNLFDIAFLSNQHLKTLFRLAWPQFTVPDFCGPYQSTYGCHKQSCRFLHLCKDYVMGKCKYGTRCKFAHDVYTDLIRLIKDRNEGLYRPQVEVLESNGEESDGDSSHSSDIHEASVDGDYMLEKVLPMAVSCAENRPVAAVISPSETKCIFPKKGWMAKLGAKSQTPSRQFLDSNNPRTMAMQEKLKEICKVNLQGRCTRGQLCQRNHCDLPYQWQVLNNGRWESVTSYRNNVMEKNFCDVNNVATCVDFDTWGPMHLYYDAMLICNYEHQLLFNIRRLEVKGEPDISDAYLISPWSWYWKDEYGTWIEYAEENTMQNTSDKDSSDFEALYDAYKNKNGGSTVKFMVGNQQYTLNFATMTQTNDHYCTRKDVRRRPSTHITSGDVKRYIDEKPWLSNNKYPSTWDMRIRTKSHRLVKVSNFGESNEEYDQIKKLFQTTLPGRKITKLERVQNELCWDAFSRQKEVMMKKTSLRPVDERQLFHGTTQEKVEDICRDNFDFRLSGTRFGAVYGQGAYFASTAKFSDSYARVDNENLKRMFVARVLVGSYTVGSRDMRRPPFKNQMAKKRGMYDSCVNNTSNPSVFVVFDNNQVYPEYLITYSTSSANQTSLYSSSSQFASPSMPFTSQPTISAPTANQTPYASSSQYFPSHYNPYTSQPTLTQIISNAMQIHYGSSNQYLASPYNPFTSQPAGSASSANQTPYGSSSQYVPSPYNPSTSQSTRSASSANQTPYSSNSQYVPSPYNQSTSQSTRSASGANQTPYSSSSQNVSSPYNPSTNQSTRSASSDNQTPYSSINSQYVPSPYNPSTSQSTRSASSANQTPYSSINSQYVPSPYNPSTSQSTRSASSANQTPYSSNSQYVPSPYNPSTSQSTGSASSANQTPYSSSSQNVSSPYNPSTSQSTRSASSANQTPYSSSSQNVSSPYNPSTSQSTGSASSANQTPCSNSQYVPSPYNPSTWEVRMPMQ